MALLENAGKVLKVGGFVIQIFTTIFRKKKKDREINQFQQKLSEYEETIFKLQQEIIALKLVNQTLRDNLAEMERKLKVVQIWAIVSTLIVVALLILLLVKH